MAAADESWRGVAARRFIREKLGFEGEPVNCRRRRSLEGMPGTCGGYLTTDADAQGTRCASRAFGSGGGFWEPSHVAPRFLVLGAAQACGGCEMGLRGCQGRPREAAGELGWLAACARARWKEEAVLGRGRGEREWACAARKVGWVVRLHAWASG